MSDYFSKKDFIVEWIDIKGEKHKTKILGKFISANEAANYIYKNKKTCAKYPTAYWI